MFRREKSVIKVKFDPYHNLPMIKAKHCTKEQILDAGLYMQGHVRIDRKTADCRTSNRRRKRENRVHKFFRIIRAIMFHKTDVSSIEDRRRTASDEDPFLLTASV